LTTLASASGRRQLATQRNDRQTSQLTFSVYWLTGTAGSAARIYYEGARTWGQVQTRSLVPTGVAVFPNDLTIRPLAERDHNVVHWAEFSHGGHFAAMEAPDLLVDDMREFFARCADRHPGKPLAGPDRSIRASKTTRSTVG
jgi:pimeloyl-ACP methyl ester carboxylesterase